MVNHSNRSKRTMKACPFCGGDGTVIPDPANKYRSNVLYRPQCYECGANLGGFDETASAVAAWNRRVSTDPRHASAGVGERCADCTLDGEACPTCYATWWQKRHPNVHQLPDALS